MKEGKYTKVLAKIQVGAILQAREIQRIFLPTFIELSWRRNVGVHSDGH